MIGALLAHLLPLAIPIAGLLCVLTFQQSIPNPMRPGTSTKPEGGDPRQNGDQH